MFQRYDDIEQSLQAVLIFYGIHADIHGLKKLSFDERAPLGTDDIQKMARQVGLDIEKIKIPAGKLDSSSYPLILILDGGQYAISFPTGSYFSTLLNKKLASEPSDETSVLSSYHGEAYVLRPLAKEFQETQSKRLAWFWDPIAKDKGKFREILVAAFFINLLALSLPIYTMNVYDRVVPNFSESTLIVLTIGIFIAIMIDMLLKTVRSFILESVASRLSVHFDGELMERLSLIPDWKIQMGTSQKAHLFNEMQGVRDYYATKLLPTLIDAPFLFLYLIAIFMICPALTLVPVVFTIMILVLNAVSWRFYGTLNHQVFQSGQKFTTQLHETLDGLLTARLSNASGVKLHRWKLALLDNAKIKRKVSFMNGMVQVIGYSLTSLSQVSVVFFGIYQIQQGNTTVGGVVATSILAGRALAPILNLGAVFSQYKKSRDLLMSLNKIFTLPHDGEKIGRLGSKLPFKGRVRTNELSFAYPQSAHPAIYNMTLEIAEKEKVGLIGQNGAGKSTLAQLLAGILDPQKGNIFLDDYLYAAISPHELRKGIGFVPQRPFLFAGTVRDNILMGETGLSASALDQAIHVSGMERTISQSGFGLDMEIGEDGAFLSAGQRQSLSLARAVIHNPPVLILDEPTNGMDHNVETHLLSALRPYLHDKTFIMVTHRTTLLPLVNRLILLEAGQIKADGSTSSMIKALGGNVTHG